MFKSKIVFTLLLSAAALLTAKAVEVKLPMKMADVAESLKDHAPEHVNVSAKGEILTINISEVESRGGFDKTHSINLKPIAGRIITISLEVKVDKVEGSGGAKAPHSIGKITFAGTTQNLNATKSGWHTYFFKNIKIPGNGLLKMRVSLKNASGEIQIRNPRASRRVSGKSRSSSSKSKSKKSKKSKSND